MSARGQNIPVAVETVFGGFCENTIVWVPQWPFDPAAMGDLSVKVTISGITGPGQSSYTYDLTLFDPSSPVRLSGSNRFETAAAVSYETWSPGVAVAYVATGGAFADALAGAGGPPGPILLTPTNGLHAATARELDRLDPGAIYVLGGPGAISNGTLQQVSAYGPTTRIAGTNRYETAAAVSAAFWSPGVDRAYVAVGTAFPDALAAGGGLPGPVLLTDGASLPAVTRAEIDRLNPTEIFVIGGTGAVSGAVEADLRSYGPVTRLAGGSRYHTAAAVSAAMYPGGSDTVYIAYGGNFPDALAAAGGNAVGPILLTDTSTLHAATAAEVARLGPTTIIVVGGPGVVGPSPAWDLVGLEQ
jgi:putative cell wall-binding protein